MAGKKASVGEVVQVAAAFAVATFAAGQASNYLRDARVAQGDPVGAGRAITMVGAAETGLGLVVGSLMMLTGTAPYAGAGLVAAGLSGIGTIVSGRDATNFATATLQNEAATRGRAPIGTVNPAAGLAHMNPWRQGQQAYAGR